VIVRSLLDGKQSGLINGKEGTSLIRNINMKAVTWKLMLYFSQAITSH
jgi:hypothetical protein